MTNSNFNSSDVLPVNFHRFFFQDLKEFFGAINSKSECIRAILSYEGDNWVVPHICGKRMAYLSITEQGEELDWDKVCGM
jgi:hypothetical protein